MKQSQLQQLLENSIDLLFERDAILLQKGYDINERTISHRLAMHIESFLIETDYDVDIEYNRMRGDYKPDAIGNLMGKQLSWEKSGEGSSYVYPDVIIHKRDSDENLLEIEIKMAWKNDKKEYDYQKINEYIKQLGYHYGAYIELNETRSDCRIELGPF